MIAWISEMDNEDWQELSPEQRMEKLEERVRLLEVRIEAMEYPKRCDGTDTTPADQ